MAYITSFTYCENIQTELSQEGPRQQIINPLQVLSPVAIPGNYSFSIACSIADIVVDSVNTLRIVFKDDNENIVNDTGEIKFDSPDTSLIEKMGGMQFNIDMRNVVLRKEGIHSTIIFFNSESIGEYKIMVRKAK